LIEGNPAGVDAFRERGGFQHFEREGVDRCTCQRDQKMAGEINAHRAHFQRLRDADDQRREANWNPATGIQHQRQRAVGGFVILLRALKPVLSKDGEEALRRRLAANLTRQSGDVFTTLVLIRCRIHHLRHQQSAIQRTAGIEPKGAEGGFQ
jgi:hypothetical protein